MYYNYPRKNYDIHYVIIEKIKNVDHWIYVFDYKNLMLYLLDSTQNIADKEIYYIDNLYRSYKNNFIISEGFHKLNKSKLLQQAYQFEKEYFNKKIYNKFYDIYEYPLREWHDLYKSLKIDKSEWDYNPRFGYILSHWYKSRPTSHSQASNSVPKTMWRKVRYNHRMALIQDEYDEEDYSIYFTHKRRYNKSDKLGWWDDYTRRQKSAGWKESSKRKHQWKIKKE